MPRKEEIELFISEDGMVQFHIKGIKGKHCIDIARALSRECGIMKDVGFSSEYYEKELTQTTAKQRIK